MANVALARTNEIDADITTARHERHADTGPIRTAFSQTGAIPALLALK
jgi:hypothetical protein